MPNQNFRYCNLTSMDLEQIEPTSMDQDIHVNISNTESILIHIPENQDLLSSEMKEEDEEHLDQIQTSQFSNMSQYEQDDQMMHEELHEIRKLKPGKKRVSLTIEKKIEIINRHEKGETQRALSQEYNIGRTTISDIIKRKYKFFKFVSMNADKEENLKRRRTLRRTVHKELEEKLLAWYNESREQGHHISGPMISAKAQLMHKELGYTEPFTASNGWLDRFKIRNGIKLCGLREVKTESDVSAVAPFKATLSEIATYLDLDLDHIYNADETDLFWKMLPNPDSDVNEVKASVRAYRERMTVLCCANANGSHKLPLVCVGRGKKSRIFTSHEIKTMPANYYGQETAWMDQDIFREWFHNQFVPSVRQHLRNQGLKETALLLIDRSTSHPEDQYLRSDDGSFICHFFPPKVKTLLQPMEQGIISSMKRYYRRDLLIDLINKGLTIAEFMKGLTIKDAIRGIARGWEQVTEETIRAGFSKIFASLPEFSVVETSDISTDAFENLIRKIPECYDYSYERLDKWLNCDEAEPQKDCNPNVSWKIDDQTEQLEDENVIYAYENPEEFDNSPLEQQTTIIIQQQQDTDDELREEIQEELVQQEVIQLQLPTENVTYEGSGDVSCSQAVDALSVVLKFMKNDAHTLYKDVMMLQDLKKKLRQRLIEQSEDIKGENEFS